MPIHFYRPVEGTVVVVDGVELPGLTWVRGGVPWTTDPRDPSFLLVARMDGDKLFIDRYPGTEGHRWAGATDQWIFEVGGGTTRVYSR
jgi:hypothetical protein